jgi:hypothetical protein
VRFCCAGKRSSVKKPRPSKERLAEAIAEHTLIVQHRLDGYEIFACLSDGDVWSKSTNAKKPEFFYQHPATAGEDCVGVDIPYVDLDTVTDVVVLRKIWETLDHQAKLKEYRNKHATS